MPNIHFFNFSTTLMVLKATTSRAYRENEGKSRKMSVNEL
jgi:hypothetical protein